MTAREVVPSMFGFRVSLSGRLGVVCPQCGWESWEHFDSIAGAYREAELHLDSGCNS